MSYINFLKIDSGVALIVLERLYSTVFKIYNIVTNFLVNNVYKKLYRTCRQRANCEVYILSQSIKNEAQGRDET